MHETTKTETIETSAVRAPVIESAAASDDSPTPAPLIVFGREDAESLCLDDTCVPAGAVE